MRGTEDGDRDICGLETIISPLNFLRIVSNKSDRHVVLIEDRDPALQFRDDGVIAMETNLARAAQVLRDMTDELSVEVKVAETEILPVTDQKKRLIVTYVDSEPMTAVALSVFSAFAREA